MSDRVSKVLNIDAPNTEPVGDPDTIRYELAATSLAILDKEDERRDFVREINEEIKKLKKRQRELAVTIKRGGIQLAMHFGTVSTDNATTPVVEKPKRGRKAKAEAGEATTH